jgi:hypothetical protein
LPLEVLADISEGITTLRSKGATVSITHEVLSHGNIVARLANTWQFL